MTRKLLILIILFAFANNLIMFAAVVKTLHVPSKVMNKKIAVNVVLPETYDASEERYPVVYLLHGYSGDHTNWPEKTGVEILADKYETIIVCPDGDEDSWYFDSPLDSSSQYETFIIHEVIPFIDQYFHTNASPAKRAITGLSMGGHGALFLAFRHPQLFGAVGSMSGGLDIRPFADNWNIKDQIGNIEEFPARWDSVSVVNLPDLVESVTFSIIIDCGVDDFFLDVNRAFHRKLLEKGIAHEYIERPGGHSWEYWDNAIKYQFFFFDQFFEKK